MLPRGVRGKRGWEKKELRKGLRGWEGAHLGCLIGLKASRWDFPRAWAAWRKARRKAALQAGREAQGQCWEAQKKGPNVRSGKEA